MTSNRTKKTIKKGRNKGGKPRLVPGEQTMRFSVNAPESLGRRIVEVAEAEGISYGEWWRRLAAKELGIEYRRNEE